MSSVPDLPRIEPVRWTQTEDVLEDAGRVIQSLGNRQSIRSAKQRAKADGSLYGTLEFFWATEIWTASALPVFSDELLRAIELDTGDFLSLPGPTGSIITVPLEIDALRDLLDDAPDEKERFVLSMQVAEALTVKVDTDHVLRAIVAGAWAFNRRVMVPMSTAGTDGGASESYVARILNYPGEWKAAMRAWARWYRAYITDPFGTWIAALDAGRLPPGEEMRDDWIDRTNEPSPIYYCADDEGLDEMAERIGWSELQSRGLLQPLDASRVSNIYRWGWVREVGQIANLLRAYASTVPSSGMATQDLLNGGRPVPRTNLLDVWELFAGFVTSPDNCRHQLPQSVRDAAARDGTVDYRVYQMSFAGRRRPTDLEDALMGVAQVTDELRSAVGMISGAQTAVDDSGYSVDRVVPGALPAPGSPRDQTIKRAKRAPSLSRHGAMRRDPPSAADADAPGGGPSLPTASTAQATAAMTQKDEDTVQSGPSRAPVARVLFPPGPAAVDEDEDEDEDDDLGSLATRATVRA